VGVIGHIALNACGSLRAKGSGRSVCAVCRLNSSDWEKVEYETEPRRFGYKCIFSTAARDSHTETARQRWSFEGGPFWMRHGPSSGSSDCSLETQDPGNIL
jgi:hypothetical protein